ncbi:non-hydrolyzing UDP-N-acetylglucosamine 2-epimerase [Rufibacter hautae]|uniref:UDP-N-acetylglucosamine 2-epimerase (non-hydrolyzing) n=1 Tax=Rufibacter hautae TaxID=2595005 RepID=A0A5B6TCH1_9BACT|nr:UDP-N-acetylglucosamine 2-epimerase (non-hydrolyzing) [Rufibacter hautae]KAA3437581.1 UDP-N-acetylglucosamine 2-epimerase (non-hydrolyzing) [Rufibacter hautae]
MKNKFLFVFGTRPEAIKMVPLIKEMRKESRFEVKVCVTGQHRQMLDQVLDFFGVEADYDLNLMKPAQTLVDITGDVLKGVTEIMHQNFFPDYVIVQGDTTTAMAGALAAFYAKVKIIHIEAGLRSGDKLSPFPEEMNRVLIGRMADLHFAPTFKATESLLSEGAHPDTVWNVGNTVIDALLLGLETIKKDNGLKYDQFFNFLDRDKRVLLVTGHRRENFGEPFENICFALKEIAEQQPDVEIVYPVHLNPNVQEPVKRILKNHPRIHLIEPLDYPYLIWLLDACYLVITDSGGIQEEAPALGKPVLVMREVTERTEGVDAGTAKLVGTDQNKIIQETMRLLNDQEFYNQMAKAVNPYGDGTTSKQILEVLNEQLTLKFKKEKI